VVKLADEGGNAATYNWTVLWSGTTVGTLTGKRQLLLAALERRRLVSHRCAVTDTAFETDHKKTARQKNLH
jgi:hypothetical protein